MRRAAGIDLVGPASLRYMLNEYWRGDMSRFRVARDATGIRIIPRDRREQPAQILNTNGKDRWLTLIVIGQERDERPAPADRRRDGRADQKARGRAGSGGGADQPLHLALQQAGGVDLPEGARVPGRRLGPQVSAARAAWG